MMWQSYQPAARYSNIIGQQASRAMFECIHNIQTQVEEAPDIVIFGSSRAGSYFNDRLLSRWVSEFSGEPKYVKRLNIAGGDISLTYLFLKEYLEKNELEIAYVEALRIKPQVSLIPYTNRAFSSTADWKLTTELARNYDDNRSGFFRVADMFRVMIDKADKYLSKLLVREYVINVQNDEACIRNKNIEDMAFKDTSTAKQRFARAYNRELSALMKNAGKANKLRKETNIRRRERALKRFRDKVGPNWETAVPENWEFDTDPAKRQLYYYKKIVELSEEKGFKLVYFRPYGLFDAEYVPAQVETYQTLLGSDIIYPPYDISKLAYRYYMDPNHAGSQSKRILALWLTEDILTRSGEF